MVPCTLEIWQQLKHFVRTFLIDMQNYLDLLRHVVDHGEHRDDRTGTGVISCFGAQLRFDLSSGFPLLTTKKIRYDLVVNELLWFLSGSTNTSKLNAHIWDQWADDNGNLGPIYGKQWRSWSTKSGNVDQISNVFKSLLSNPKSRRHVVSAWNATDLPDETETIEDNIRAGRMALAPCHVMFQFYVTNSGRLSCHFYQRSADMFLGVPFNIASYATLTHIFANCLGLAPGELVYSLGDYHVYTNHLNQVKIQLDRAPRQLPELIIDKKHDDPFSFVPADFNLVSYSPHPAIKAPIAV